MTLFSLFPIVPKPALSLLYDRFQFGDEKAIRFNASTDRAPLAERLFNPTRDTAFSNDCSGTSKCYHLGPRAKSRGSTRGPRKVLASQVFPGRLRIRPWWQRPSAERTGFVPTRIRGHVGSSLVISSELRWLLSLSLPTWKRSWCLGLLKGPAEPASVKCSPPSSCPQNV